MNDYGRVSSLLSLVRESIKIRHRAVLERRRARLLENLEEMDVLSQQLGQMKINKFCYQQSTETLQRHLPIESNIQNSSSLSW